MTNALLTVGLELAFLAFALRGPDEIRLRVFSTVNMLAVSLYAPRMMELFGYRNNIASIFYTFVLLSQAVMFYRYGARTTIRSVGMILYAIVIAIGLSWAVQLFPVISTAPAAAALAVVIDRSTGVVAASVAAFVIAQAVLVLTLRYGGLRWMSYVIGILLAQAVDSAVFYPLAFWSQSAAEMWALVTTGIAFKVGFSAVAALPIVVMVRYIKPSPLLAT